MNLVRLTGIEKNYGMAEAKRFVLRGIDLSVCEGELLAIKGRSGSGKTTLLNLIAGIDFPSGGEYFFRDERIALRNQNEASKFRRKHIGMVVQHFALIDDLSVYENIAMPLWIDKLSESKERELVNQIMKELGIYELRKQYPRTLSGGEKQRTAIARAVIRNPDLLLADEPTGALDEANGKQIIELFRSLNSQGKTIVVVTHDDVIAQSCDREVHIVDGLIS